MAGRARYAGLACKATLSQRLEALEICLTKVNALAGVTAAIPDGDETAILNTGYHPHRPAITHAMPRPKSGVIFWEASGA